MGAARRDHRHLRGHRPDGPHRAGDPDGTGRDHLREVRGEEHDDAVCEVWGLVRLGVRDCGYDRDCRETKS